MSLIGYDFDQDGPGKALLDEITTLKFCETPEADGHYKGFVTMQDMDCSAGPPTADNFADNPTTAESTTADDVSAASSRRGILLATVAVLVAAVGVLVEDHPDE